MYPVVMPHHPAFDKPSVIDSVHHLGLPHSHLLVVLNNLDNVPGIAIDRVYEESKKYGFRIERLRNHLEFGEIRGNCSVLARLRFPYANWHIHLDDDCSKRIGPHTVSNLIKAADKMGAGVAGFCAPGSIFGEWQDKVDDFTSHIPILGGCIAIHRENPVMYQPWVNAVDIQYSLESLAAQIPVCRSTRTVLSFLKGRRSAQHTHNYDEIKRYWKDSPIKIAERFDGKKYRIRIYNSKNLLKVGL